MLDSGFQSPGFRIPQAKISWIPESGFPYMGRMQCMTSNSNDNLFWFLAKVCLLLFSLKHYVIKQLLDLICVISGIIRVSVSIISLSLAWP